MLTDQVVDAAVPTGSEKLDVRALSKLRWRCRRGLLENDLFLERFFARHEAALTVMQGKALSALMELSDNDLLDLLLARKPLEAVDAELDSAVDRTQVRQVLEMLKGQS